MYMAYFTSDRFPFAQGSSAGPFTRFPGVPGLGFYRPNQALTRVYTTRSALSGLRGLGDASSGISLTDPATLLMIGGGVLLLSVLGVFGGRKASAFNKKRRRRKVRRLQGKILQLQA